MKNIKDAKDVFLIDRYNLAEEYVRQPDLRKEYSRKSADASEEYRRAKARLAVVEAEVKMEIRKDPASFELDKITEDSVKNAMVLDSRYQEALDEEIKAEHNAAIHSGYLRVLDDRKQSITDLLKMVLADFYPHPYIDRGALQEKMRTDEAASAFRKPKKK